MSEHPEQPRKPESRFRRWLPFGVTVLATALVTAGVVALLVNIMEHKEEGRNPYAQVVPLDEDTVDPAVWGKNFPAQYDSYKRTVDQQRTRYGGSEALPHSPTKADPRSVVAQSRLEEDPRLKTMWAGYAFSHDFREERGHAHMLADQMFTGRQAHTKQPGTCLNCHASMVKAYRDAGEGDMLKGFHALNKMPYKEAVKHVQHPVSCIDCHDPKTMQLRVTRPAFMAGIKAVKAAQGVEDFDVNRDATRQEMRSFTCGQCHVEYYFKGKEKTLTYPWTKGLKVEAIYQYYKENPHTDFVHAKTGAKVLKAQHPEFEMYNQGIHARSGVTCADCHMPYKREGAQKVSDHHVRSPMLNINRSCQTCHKWPEEELKSRVEALQERTQLMRNHALNALMDLVKDVEEAKKKGVTDAQLAKVHELQRQGQFYVDFVESENSAGFHAPEEALRILGEAINYIRLGQLELRKVAPTVAAAR